MSRPKSPIKHGTPYGYTRHLRDGVPVCDECKEALLAYHRDYRAKLRGEQPDDPARVTVTIDALGKVIAARALSPLNGPQAETVARLVK